MTGVEEEAPMQRPDGPGVRGLASSTPIECPGHGPMRRRYHFGILVDVRCERCGKQPIDLLESVRVASPTPPPPPPRNDPVSFRVTRELTVTAPRGDHAEAMRRANDLWHNDEPWTQEVHNLMAAHHDRITTEMVDPQGHVEVGVAAASPPPPPPRNDPSIAERSKPRARAR